MSFKVISINKVKKTMVIDWGWCTLNHHIPETLLGEGDAVSTETASEIVATMEPDRPVEAIVNSGLLNLVVGETPLD